MQSTPYTHLTTRTRDTCSLGLPRSLRLFALALLLCLGSQTSTAQDSDRGVINALLDDFHLAAAEADAQRYLDHFAPEGVFMGTDDWERWPLPEFRKYVSERFAGGTGWTYTPENRVVTLADDSEVAWFDEIMVSERWGRFRGTGVLSKQDGQWKIAHYSLTALVPNERFADVAEIAMEGFEAREAHKSDDKLE